MINKLIAVVFLFCFATTTLAQDVTDSLSDLATDLGELQKELDAIRNEQITTMEAALMSAGIGTAHWGSFGVSITTPKASIFSGASEAASKVSEVPEGTQLRVLDKVGSWYAVGLGSEMINGTTDARTGWVMASDVVPNSYAVSNSSELSVSDRIYDAMLEKVQQLKTKYDDNPHVIVKGFNIDISISPALSIGFEFK